MFSHVNIFPFINLSFMHNKHLLLNDLYRLQETIYLLQNKIPFIAVKALLLSSERLKRVFLKFNF